MDTLYQRGCGYICALREKNQTKINILKSTKQVCCTRVLRMATLIFVSEVRHQLKCVTCRYAASASRGVPVYFQHSLILTVGCMARLSRDVGGIVNTIVRQCAFYEF